MTVTPTGSGLDLDNSLSNPETSLSYEPTQTSSGAPSLDHSDQVVFEHKKTVGAVVKLSLISLAALVLCSGIGLFFFFQRENTESTLQAGSFPELHLSLKGLGTTTAPTDNQILKVRGQLEVTESLILSPSGQPKNPLSGQLYFDKDRDQMQYYDGSQFVLLQGGSGATITNISNISTGGSSSTTNIFNSSTSVIGGGPTLTGSAGYLALFTDATTLGNSLIQQTGTNLQVAASGTTSVTVGSSTSSSSTTIQGGTGNLGLATGGSGGVTGSISITTGDSTSTASGNILIDSGSGIIDGEVIEDKTFESGLDNMQDWFNTSLTTTTVQAHSGSQSLQVTPSGQFWGIIEILPGVAVTPGHQYHFSIWVRAATTPRTIGASIVWEGTGGSTTAFTSIVDSATGWTEMTLTAPAPAGATSVIFRAQSSTGAAGDIHYFDDMSITDLSSGTAISAIDLGSTNAKVITIGNLNQIGATTIRGGSGVSIQSGAASTIINGGALSFTGNSASTLTTTSGALTLTSAAASTWGVGTAASGIGGSLTLRAGQGGSDGNNDGGDLVLQGGARNGTGSPGSVIVRPPTDVADAFQIQNSASVPFLIADSVTKNISITGTSTSFALLTLDNTHFRSTQTVAPTISTPLNCGTTPTAAVIAGSTDTAGSLTITTGTGSSASNCDVTLTFNRPYASAPKSIIIVGKADAGSVARQIYVSNSTTTGLTAMFAVSAAGANSTTYSFNYWIVE